MGLKPILTLLPLLAAPLVQAQNSDATTTSTEVRDPTYTPEECNSWVGTLQASDNNLSGGLSESEYHTFLSNIEEPAYISEYFTAFQSFDKLPWSFRIVHKSLACHCKTLGMGDGCCEGDDAEILLLGLDSAADENGGIFSSGARIPPQDQAYKEIFCQQVSYVLTKSVPSPAPTLEPTGSPTGGPTQSPSTASPTGSLTQSPTSSPVGAAIVEVRSVSNTGTEEEDKGLSTGGVIGIALAAICVVIAIIVAVEYRKELERNRLRKFAGSQADLESPPPGGDEEVYAPWPNPEPDNDPGGPEDEPKDDDESDAPSVWSEGDEADDTEKLYDVNVGVEVTAGSALAAMGAASTVTANLRRSSGGPGVSSNQVQDFAQ